MNIILIILYGILTAFWGIRFYQELTNTLIPDPILLTLAGSLCGFYIVQTILVLIGGIVI